MRCCDSERLMSGRGRRRTGDGCSAAEFIVRPSEAALAKRDRRSATRERRGEGDVNGGDHLEAERRGGAPQ